MINYFKRTIHDSEIKKISCLQKGCWIRITDPSDLEIDKLTNEFKLDKQNLISGLDQNELPRIDFVNNNIYIFVKTIDPILKTRLNTYLIIITKNYLFTLTKTSPTFVKNILNNQIEFITTQKLKCLIKIFSLINSDFEKTTINIVKIVNTEKTVTDKLDEVHINNLLQQESALNSLISSYYYLNLLYQRITKKIHFFEEDKNIIEDLIIDTNQSFNLCKSSLKTISNIRTYYTIILSNKLNKTINILTIFTIFISIPAAISGIYGMNIRLPFQHNYLSFYYIILIIIAISGIFLFYFKKKKLL